MKKLLLLAPLALLLAFAGCDLGHDVSGTLVLSLQDKVSARTIQPSLDMAPATWDVVGTGPGGAAFSQIGVTSATVIQKSLIPGEWLIAVTARNAGGVAIGYGSITIAVAAGEVACATVIVRPIVGSGTLDATVTWPAGVLTTPALSAELAPAGSGFAPIPVVAGVDSASHLGIHASGYYTLKLLLQDEGAVVWGTVEAVRIIAGETSTALFALTNDVNRGGLQLQIVTDLQNPITVTLNGPAKISSGNAMTVSATTSEAVDGYQWYLQGAPIGGNSSSVTVGTGLGLGHYWLSLVVTKGAILSSESMEFDVVPPIIRDFIFTINVTSGTFAGAVYHGSFSVDTATLTNAGPETLSAALIDFQFDPFGGYCGPISRVGDAVFVDGALSRIELVTSSSGRSFGFNLGFDPWQIPPDLASGLWFGYLNTWTIVDGFGPYTLTEVSLR